MLLLDDIPPHWHWTVTSLFRLIYTSYYCEVGMDETFGSSAKRDKSQKSERHLNFWTLFIDNDQHWSGVFYILKTSTQWDWAKHSTKRSRWWYSSSGHSVIFKLNLSGWQQRIGSTGNESFRSIDLGWFFRFGLTNIRGLLPVYGLKYTLDKSVLTTVVWLDVYVCVENSNVVSFEKVLKSNCIVKFDSYGRWP